jgi:hypothetical protein
MTRGAYYISEEAKERMEAVVEKINARSYGSFRVNDFVTDAISFHLASLEKAEQNREAKEKV